MTPLLALSFWSSGIFLVRGLATYGFWSSGVLLGGLFALSIPLALVSIYAVRRMTARSSRDIVLPVLACALLMHGAALGFGPQLYALAPSEALGASAWLLWFGGAALALTARGIIRETK